MILVMKYTSNNKVLFTVTAKTVDLKIKLEFIASFIL